MAQGKAPQHPDKQVTKGWTEAESSPELKAMRLPFWLKDDDWENLPPRKSDGLGDDEHLTEKERQRLDLFRLLDRRSEWTAKTLVSRHNFFLLLFPLILALVLAVGPQNVVDSLKSLLAYFK
jgi:hypothetical protein